MRIAKLITSVCMCVHRDGYLYQYSSEEDDVPKGEYKIRHCGGCQRVSNEGKQYAFSVS